jgi:apolipoprotein N-acyltransferase
MEQTAGVARQARIVVWPEHLLGESNPLPRLAAARNRVCVIASFAEPGPSGKPYNTARVISPSGESLATFRKYHLFGKEQYTHERGQVSKPVRVAGHRVGVPICFDTVHSNVCRALVRSGAQVLLVPNHDPEMPNSMFNHLHSAIIAFRAAENGTPIAWSECYGMSLIVDSTGEVIARAPAGKIMGISGTVHVNSRRTFYTFAGDYFVWLCAGAAVCLLVVPWFSRSMER